MEKELKLENEKLKSENEALKLENERLTSLLLSKLTEETPGILDISQMPFYEIVNKFERLNISTIENVTNIYENGVGLDLYEKIRIFLISDHRKNFNLTKKNAEKMMLDKAFKDYKIKLFIDNMSKYLKIDKNTDLDENKLFELIAEFLDVYILMELNKPPIRVIPIIVGKTEYDPITQKLTKKYKVKSVVMDGLKNNRGEVLLKSVVKIN